MRLWHATAMRNLPSIMQKGLVPQTCGMVFFADHPVWAAVFAKLRYPGEKIIALPVELPRNQVVESDDHCSKVFKCKCYTIRRVVKPSEIKLMDARYWRTRHVLSC